MHDAFLLTTINLRRGRVRKKRKSRRSGFRQVLPKKDRGREATVSGPYSVVPILELWETDSKNGQMSKIITNFWLKRFCNQFLKDNCSDHKSAFIFAALGTTAFL